MKRFHLKRTEDVSGVSGIGNVAEGIEFTDGTCVMRWLSAKSSIAIYANIKLLLGIHGHDGKTTVQFIDKEESSGH